MSGGEKRNPMTRIAIPYTLNANQLHVLILMYKFRYCTVPLLAAYIHQKNHSVLQRTVHLLFTHGYLERRYDLTYKIDRKPAIYWLSPAAIRYLRDDDRLDQQVLHTYYKNKVLSQEAVDHALTTLRVYVALKERYGDAYDIFTRQEIAHVEDMPKTKPDLYLRGKKGYVITLAHDMPLFLTRKQLRDYIAYSEDGGWGCSSYPSLLYVFTSIAHATQFLTYAKNLLNNAGIPTNELPIGVTTIDRLTKKPYPTTIWTFGGGNMAPKGLSA